MKLLLFTLISFSLFAKDPNPIKKLNGWFKDEKARTEGRFFKLASLATVSSDGVPHSRIVEITSFNQKDGAQFFTHQNTRKVQDLNFNPHASLNIYLPRTKRQLSIEGVVTQIPREAAEKSWKKMPRYTKVIFLCSNKTGVIESQDILEKRKQDIEKEYPNEIPCPSSFIGYRLKPHEIIFFEMQHRSFPLKEVATLNKDAWNIAFVEP